MAPTSSTLVPRQGFGDNGPGGFGDGDRRGPGDGGGVSKWAILGIVIAIAVIGLIVAFVVFRRIRRRRSRNTIPAIKLQSATANKPISASPSTSDPSKYGANSNGGYTATADQNQSLLGHAEAPAILTWNPSTSEHGGVGSTQDGFGYDNNLNLTGGIQRPASVASFSAPPPRYEEATGSSAGGLRPQGEAASYFNPAVSMGQERGRSLTRDGEGSRGRALSVDQRSIDGDRRRSTSRFREEGMIDVNVDAKT
ncbi:uncharacterized protein A1O5_04145 [Cladophialophora psammophila CBS 110553]|uniref:Uncharacterized protein n=1 Tax=Cladophialophora psammophila CBS 110553 TaxID=1182543 RepID=W9X7V2_9EURO|nr:uncharacterized protein A1O5_04145 [Cladophialophora psammophila CBS 110553]EXJ72996.1 hypothetical protein A1O5_04145 [Cladophialophora psammophila CBS 110553]